MADEDRKKTYAEFRDAVNMRAAELERWLHTDESRAVGAKGESGGESTGHRSGRRILEILATAKAELTEADYAHMTKVIGYVKRHTAQRPDGDVSETPWRYSLMNWGHDPQK